MSKKSLLIMALLLLTSYLSLQAQTYSMGANFSVESIDSTQFKIPLSFRSFQSLPPSYSLEKYAPTPGNQGNYGTCAAWANGYSIPTILYAKTHGLTDRSIINPPLSMRLLKIQMIKTARVAPILPEPSQLLIKSAMCH